MGLWKTTGGLGENMKNANSIIGITTLYVISLKPKSYIPIDLISYKEQSQVLKPKALAIHFVGVLGLEPRMTGPESVVLPLHHTPKCHILNIPRCTNADAKVHLFFKLTIF